MNNKTAKNNPTKKEVVLEPPRGWFKLRLGEIWEFNELFYFLTWRDIKIRYKQTVLGAAWAIIQPLVSMVIFSVVFGKLAKLPSEGIPYPIFSYTALLPWHLFSRALSEAASSLVSNQRMITRIYFPRIFLPTASIISGLVDFSISFLVLLGMMMYYKISVTWNVLFLPFFLLLAVINAMAVGMWLSALNVRYRDVKYITAYLLQIWLYATPIAYSASLIPENWSVLYSLNPMVGVVNGFRWALLGQTFEISSLFFVSVGAVIVLFFSGLVYFQRMDQTFADLV